MNNILKIIIGIMIPFMGTTLGALGVLLPVKRDKTVLGKAQKKTAKKTPEKTEKDTKKDTTDSKNTAPFCPCKKGITAPDYKEGTASKIMSGFSAGVMIASSVWSLLIPSIESSANAKYPWFPSVAGFFLGASLLLLFDRVLDYFEGKSNCEGGGFSLKTFGAVTLHNIPEGIAVGIALAGAFFGCKTAEWDSTAPAISLAGAISLSLGIAIQNIPEGAIISVPFYVNGMKRSRALALGILSGAVEPAASVVALLLTSVFVPKQPYLLSFAAGAMIYVCISELIPEGCSDKRGKYGCMGFVAGFLIMMALDTALG